MSRSNVNPNLKPSTTTTNPSTPAPARIYQDTSERARKQGLIESPGGKFWHAAKWDCDHLNALRRLLSRFGFYGQYIDDRLASLYNAGLHLPIETQADWTLIQQGTKGFKDTAGIEPAVCFLEILRTINAHKAEDYK